MLNATPVTIPGRAIGSTIRIFTVLLPKKSKPFIANAKRVPRMDAITIAPVATSTEFKSAIRIGS